MTFSVISTQSFAVLGDFDDAASAQAAVRASLDEGRAKPTDLLVFVYDDDGSISAEVGADDLAAWVEGGTRRSRR